MNQLAEHDREELAWQRGIWDRYPEIYQRVALAPGQHVRDLGAVGVNLSPAMLAVAQQRAVDLGVTNVWFREGRKESCYEDAARVSGVS
jgi:hypothetical protein